MKQENIDINDIVKIEQMPIVFEQLEKIGTLIDEKTKDLDTLECTEENKQEVKKRRTEINNTLKILEDKRKEIKTKLLEPYNVFEEKYENECKTKLQNASELLKGKIDTIESQQLLEKENELREFANQHIKANNLSCITFDDIPINITLSASMKSLKEEIKRFIEEVSNDIELIKMEEYSAEILELYLNNEYTGFDFSKSKLEVINRHKRIEELQKQQEEKLEQEKQEEEIIGKVEEIIEVPKEIIEDDEVIVVQFNVKGEKSKIKELKNKIIELGLEWY